MLFPADPLPFPFTKYPIIPNPHPHPTHTYTPPHSHTHSPSHSHIGSRGNASIGACVHYSRWVGVYTVCTRSRAGSGPVCTQAFFFLCYRNELLPRGALDGVWCIVVYCIVYYGMHCGVYCVVWVCDSVLCYPLAYKPSLCPSTPHATPTTHASYVHKSHTTSYKNLPYTTSYKHRLPSSEQHEDCGHAWSKNYSTLRMSGLLC